MRPAISVPGLVHVGHIPIGPTRRVEPKQNKFIFFELTAWLIFRKSCHFFHYLASLDVYGTQTHPND